MATLLKTIGDPVFIEPANGAGFALGELQALVGGFIEVVPTHYEVVDHGPVFMVLNEDGKHLGLPINHYATALLHQAGGRPDDLVVGDVVLATQRELDEPEEDGST
jgi:hypothetical protein